MEEVARGNQTALLKEEAQLSREGAEQRNEERYPVACDAEVFVPGRTQMFRGTMTNISPSGCYVRTVAWVRLPLTTEVEIVFALKGRMVRARAEARFAQSRTGVGLRFLALEREMQWKLDTLIAGLRKVAAEAQASAQSPLAVLSAEVSSSDIAGLEASADIESEAVAGHTSA